MPISLSRHLLSIATLLGLFWCAPSATAASQEIPLQIETLLRETDTDGTVVIYDLRFDRMWTYNPQRAAKPYSPASTFKIMNSLIGLDSGAVADIEHDKLPWDGKVWLIGGEALLPRACDADISLRVAFPNSCVPAYQALARRVGSAKYQSYLAASRYGNAGSSGPVDLFWLNGNLRISALEQIDFLKRLVLRTLPFSTDTFNAVDELSIIERTATYTLHWKTGWADSEHPAVGWLVGWLERDDDRYLFALNIDLRKPEHAAARMIIMRAALKQAGMLPD